MPGWIVETALWLRRYFWELLLWVLHTAPLLIGATAIVIIAGVIYAYRTLTKIRKRPEQPPLQTEGPAEPIRAFIFLKVPPKLSDDMARRFSQRRANIHGPDVKIHYVVAVWGEWDVILLVESKGMVELLKYLREVIQKDERIKSTETLIIRGDQPKMLGECAETPRDGWNWAFLMVKTRRALWALEQLKPLDKTLRNASIVHYAGLLGRYDVAIVAQYATDGALSELVMRHLQDLDVETLTMPAVRNMMFIDGKSVNEIGLPPIAGAVQ